MNQIWMTLSYKRTTIICLDMMSKNRPLEKNKQQIYRSIKYSEAQKKKGRHGNFEGE